MTQSFVARKLEIAVKLPSQPSTNQPKSFAGGGDTVTLSGNRMSVRIQNAGAPGGSTARVMVYGLNPSLMNQLSTLGMVFNIVEGNTLSVLAGDDENGVSVCFSGTITAAYADYNSSPNVPFQFEVSAGLAQSVLPAAASSYTGATDVATIMSSLATQMALTFENNGVDVKLSSPYFSGNLTTQMRECAEAANINAAIINGQTLAIWPKGGNRETQNIPLISPPTGMVGYPSFTQNGIVVKTLFNPQITFGSLIKVQSMVTDGGIESISANPGTLPADGVWSIYKMDHALDTKMPKGQWMSTIFAYNPRYPRPVAPGPQG